MFFAMIHCTEKITNSNFVVFVLGTFPSTHGTLSRPLLAGSDNTIMSYYSNKSFYFWKTFLQKLSDKCQALHEPV